MTADLAGRRAALRDDGFTPLGPVLDEVTLARLRQAAVDFCAARPPPGPYGGIYHNAWQQLPMLAEILARGELGALAAELIDGPEVVLFQDHLVDKRPGTTAELRWHQDSAYWPLVPSGGITFWIALEDADEENGCLRFIPGTHALGARQAADFVDGAAQPRKAQLLPLEPEAFADRIVALPIAAGEGIGHDPLVWHMSPPNPSPRSRLAWSISWAVADARWEPDRAPHPFRYSLGPSRGAPLEGPLFPRFARGR